MSMTKLADEILHCKRCSLTYLILCPRSSRVPGTPCSEVLIQFNVAKCNLNAYLLSMITPFLITLLLISPWLLALLAQRLGLPNISTRSAGIWGLGIAFLFFALGHFVQTDQMVQLLPLIIPFRKELIWLTGLLEIVIAFMLFFQTTRRTAAKIAFTMLVVFFPANVYGALNSVDFGGHALGWIYLLVRLPLQLLLLFWAYWFGFRRA